MKAITIYQPWASLIAAGAKKYETRSWHTGYRGPIAIHAGKTIPSNVLGSADFTFIQNALVALGLKDERQSDISVRGLSTLDKLPCGAIIATTELVECWKCETKTMIGDRYLRKYTRRAGEPVVTISIPQNSREMLFGDFSMGRFAWEFANLKLLPEPIPVRGQQGLWEWRAA